VRARTRTRTDIKRACARPSSFSRIPRLFFFSDLLQGLLY
jgi:hypothetical protein